MSSTPPRRTGVYKDDDGDDCDSCGKLVPSPSFSETPEEQKANLLQSQRRCKRSLEKAYLAQENYAACVKELKIDLAALKDGPVFVALDGDVLQDHGAAFVTVSPATANGTTTTTIATGKKKLAREADDDEDDE